MDEARIQGAIERLRTGICEVIWPDLNPDLALLETTIKEQAEQIAKLQKPIPFIQTVTIRAKEYEELTKGAWGGNMKAETGLEVSPGGLEAIRRHYKQDQAKIKALEAERPNLLAAQRILQKGVDCTKQDEGECEADFKTCVQGCIKQEKLEASLAAAEEATRSHVKEDV